MSKPTLVFVPGFWEGPQVFSAIVSNLESQHSYNTKTVPLASTGTAPPHAKTFTDDVRGVALMIEELADQGKELLLVMHSAGSFIGSQAVKGQGLAERKSKGECGGVVKLVFLAGACFPEGTEHPDQPFFKYEGDRMYPVSPLTTLFNDIPIAEAEVFIKDHMSHQPASGWDDQKISYCGWRDIQSVYLCCEGDTLLPPSIQHQIAEMTGAEVESCNAGHMVVLSQPETVVEVVRRAAGEDVGINTEKV